MNRGRLLKLTKLGANVLYLNLLGFLLAFSILSQSPGLLNMQGGGDYDQGSRDVAGVTKLTQHARPTWITTSLTDKTSALPPLYVTENGATRPLTINEWATWKSRAATWFQNIGLTGFIGFAEALLALNADGTTFAPAFEGAGPLKNILADQGLQRHVFKTLKDHAWNAADLPDAAGIDRATSSEVDHQFKVFAGCMYKVLAALTEASAPKDTERPASACTTTYSTLRMDRSCFALACTTRLLHAWP